VIGGDPVGEMIEVVVVVGVGEEIVSAQVMVLGLSSDP